MMLMDALAEARIREAQQRGELEGLPGAGEPLLLDDLSMVPESLLRILLNVNRYSGGT